MRVWVTTESSRPPLSRVLVAWTIVGSLLLVATLGGNFFKPVLDGFAVSREIVRQRQEYARQARENRALEAELQFLRSDAGKRWAVRQRLGRVEPGWQVGRTVEGAPTAAAKRSRAAQAQAWLAQLKATSAQKVREVGEIINTWAQGPQQVRKAHRRNLATQELSKKKVKPEQPPGTPDTTGVTKQP